MSIRELFTNRTNKSLSANSLSTASLGIEGEKYIEVQSRDKNRFVPNVDFSRPRNFAKYGSAEEYYKESFDWITENFPYDGSLREKLAWENSSSAFDLYVFENLYPRTNGYIELGKSYSSNSTVSYNNHIYSSPSTPDYIQIKGVMNTGSLKRSGMADLSDGFKESNLYDVADSRETNLKFDVLNSGSTVEFWYKFGDQEPSSTQVLFDLWNGVTTGSEATPNLDYGRFTLEATGSISGSMKLLVTAQSGSTGIFQQELGEITSPKNWNHYSIRLFTDNDADLIYELYLNGNLDESKRATSQVIDNITGSIIANIGALRVAPSGSTILAEGDGAVSGSIDEFRYWKTKRTHKDIGRFWFTQVGGGTNKDDANVELGVYYKFNEGVVGSTSTDKYVIDYSGRTSWGIIENYVSGSRNTGSAMVLAGAAPKEFKDPIIYKAHPTLKTERSNWIASGSNYDVSNNASLINSFPNWQIEESKGLKFLTQILSSYFDQLHMQIGELPKLKNVTYTSASNKPYPFSGHLLDDAGFVSPEIFERIDSLSQIYNRDEDREFEDKLYDIKNLIYKNIYNNITDIYKRKGTEESFKQILRSWGVDEKVVSINYYPKNETLYVEDSFTERSVTKKTVDFNRNSRFAASVFQQTSSADPESVNYIYGSAGGVDSTYPVALEYEVIFPAKPDTSRKVYASSSFPDITASVGGFYAPITGNLDDLTWETGSYGVDMQIYAVRDEIGSKNVKFILTGSTFNAITSSYIEDVYDNQKWNLAVRIYPEAREFAGISSGSDSGNYVIDFYGVNSILDSVVNEFSATGTVANAVGKTLITSPKRVYGGARRQNFTGSVLNRADIKLSQVRYWRSYLDNQTIIKHTRDLENYGANILTEDINLGKNTTELFAANSLALAWDFQEVTGSDNLGQFSISDVSSGSTEVVSRYNDIGNIVGKQHTGRGFGFPVNQSSVVDKVYWASAKQSIPEKITSRDTIDILSGDDESVTKETRPTKYFVSFEKSVYRGISEEMLNWFAGVREFNTVVGSNFNRYNPKYRELDKLRQIFFTKVNSRPQVEKYIEFYKWFDTALFEMLKELIPASADASEKIRTVIESHVLERNKYWNKLPFVERKAPDEIVAPVYSANRLKYNWQYGHYPTSGNENEHSIYWKYKASRTTGPLSTGNSNIDEDRENIRLISRQGFVRKDGQPFSYEMKYVNYAPKPSIKHDVQNFLEDTSMDGPNSDGSGYKYMWTSTDSTQKAYVQNFVDITDVFKPNIKKKYKFSVIIGDSVNDINNGQLYFPFLLFSSSVSGGVDSKLRDNTGKSLMVGNKIHQDNYSTFQNRAMQSPFTQKFVGSYEYRSQNINSGSSDATNRIEGFYVSIDTDNKRIGVYDPSTEFIKSGSSNISTTSWPKERIRREEYAARPVNIKNHKRKTRIIGNYSDEYEIAFIGNKETNNFWFTDFTGSVQTPEVATLRAKRNFALVERSQTTGSRAAFDYQFSSPGDRYSLSRGYKNLKTGVSVYTGVNYRNLKIRQKADAASRTIVTGSILLPAPFRSQ